MRARAPGTGPSGRRVAGTGDFNGDATDDLLLRASASTGFRAPSLQQVYFSSTFTDFVAGVPMDVVLAPNGGKVANAAGIPKLLSRMNTIVAVFEHHSRNDLASVVFDKQNVIISNGEFRAATYAHTLAVDRTAGRAAVPSRGSSGKTTPSCRSSQRLRSSPPA